MFWKDWAKFLREEVALEFRSWVSCGILGMIVLAIVWLVEAILGVLPPVHVWRTLVGFWAFMLLVPTLLTAFYPILHLVILLKVKWEEDRVRAMDEFYAGMPKTLAMMNEVGRKHPEMAILAQQLKAEL